MVKKSQVVEPEDVKRYLESKFDDDLARVQTVMRRLAKSYSPKELAERAYGLYEQFRQAIPGGVKGWGAKGKLDLGLIEKMADQKG